MKKPNLRLEVLEIQKTEHQRIEILGLDISQRSSNFAKSIDSNKPLCEEGPFKVIIEGVWTQSYIVKHSIIHLLNPLFDNQTYSVNNSAGFLIVEPDKLLTCTFVASSLFCERKTWLNNIFLGQVGTNRAMLVGTLVHEVFQYGVKNRIADTDKLVKFLDDLLDDATIMLEVYSVELHLKDIRKEAISYITSVKEWIEKYMFTGPRHCLTNDSELEVKVIGINDIEENVWSTKYGLKGKIDVTGSVRIYDKRNKSVTDKTIPLELKTGNPNLSSSHAAQVSLYSMMIEDRYSETNQGFVIYLKDRAAMHNVPLTHNIKRDLIQRRNQIVYHMKSYYSGPEMIDQTRMCQNCERLTECVLMSDIYSPGKLKQYSCMKSLESDAIGHLDDRFRTFFKKYHEKLVSLMCKTSPIDVNSDEKGKAEPSFWTHSSAEAERNGTGFGNLRASFNCDKPSSLVTFHRHPEYKHSQESVENGNIYTDDCGERSSKKRKIEDYFKPLGKVVGIPSKLKPFDTSFTYSRCRMAVSLDYDDHNMDRQNSSTAIAIGFINYLKEDHFVMKLYEGTLDSLKPDLMYRVDKLEKRVQIDIERLVLVRLLTREDWRCDKIRQLILDPDFRPQENAEFKLFVLTAGFDEISNLDEVQQKFVVESVCTNNYYIMDEKVEPEKARVHLDISVLIRVINILERTVLIVGQSVDHLVDLMKILQQKKVKFILIDDGKSTKARYQFPGNLVKVPQSDSLDLGKKYDSYIRQHENASVVVTSYAMSIGGLLFTRRTFDYCIAYDCDNTELLVSLSPMFCSDRHIIIDVRDGVRRSDSLREANHDISLGDHLRSLR